MNSQFWLRTQMCDHWRNIFSDAINDFMMGKYFCLSTVFFNKRLCDYYPERPVCFVHFLANSPKATYLFSGFSLYVYYLLLAFSLFWKMCTFSHELQKCYSTRRSYLTWKSPSIILFANKHDYSNNKEWQQ